MGSEAIHDHRQGEGRYFIASNDVSDKNAGFGLKPDLTKVDALPDWISVGESVLVRPYSYSGIIAYVGPTDFAAGIWIGVELDAPTGKNDGTVNGQRYFACRAKCGIFVKIDKVIQDKRGRALRNYAKPEIYPTSSSVSAIHRTMSKGEGLHLLHRSRSRRECFPTSGMRSVPKNKK